MSAYRDDLFSVNARLAALSAEVASMPAIAPLRLGLLPPEKYDELEALKTRLRATFAAPPTALTVQTLQADVAELRGFVNQLGAYVASMRNRPWPIPEPFLPPTWMLGNRTSVPYVVDRWGWQLDHCRAFGCGMRSDFERNGTPLLLSVFGHGHTFALLDQRMRRLLRAGIPKRIGVLTVRRRSVFDVVTRRFSPPVAIDPEFDAHFTVRGNGVLAPALLTPVRNALLAGKDTLMELSIGGGAVSLKWESSLEPETVVLQDWPVAVVTGIVETVRAG